MHKLIVAVMTGMLLVSCQTPEPFVPTETQPNLGEPVIHVPSDPISLEPTETLGGGQNLVRSTIYISATELLIMESFPIQVMLSVTGDLATPCDIFAYEIQEPNGENQIHIDIYSLVDISGTCIQVLAPFEENISVLSLDTALEDGVYTVWANGELVGEFNYPGG
ncbi:MAG: hypothetical protein N2C13_03170 [Chloroflexota bacterium]